MWQYGVQAILGEGVAVASVFNFRTLILVSIGRRRTAGGIWVDGRWRWNGPWMLIIDVGGLYPALEAQVSHPGPHDHVYQRPDTDELRGYLVGALLAELLEAADPQNGREGLVCLLPGQ
jgi:hypothetical protein